MQKQNKVALILIILSFVLLIPGLTTTMISIQLDSKINAQIVSLNAQVLNQSRSIWGTIVELWEHNNQFVSFLILLFSVLVPVAKGILLLIALLKKERPELQSKIFRFVKAIGKWSMADVFVVGVFIAYLSTRDQLSVNTQNVSLMGMKLPIKIMAVMSSSLGAGFFLFLSYCIVSLIALQIMKIPEKR